ncbi:MAG: peptide chain release factor N(5)-glutamine methyltransferase [Candidatus Hydrogenedentes bacterium]|nr:peptide chain release factor N(5)-glutamine methyltransferase [Candidatus Hydrogenedentota bacterium]
MPYVWEILNRITASLAHISDSPRFEAELLLSYALNITRSDLLAKVRSSTDLPPTLDEIVAQRLRYKPLAYILGYTEFYSLKIFTEPPVFIPRPETELLVEKAIEIIEHFPSNNLKILELCTGTGCIPIAILKNTKKNIFFISTDISESAVRLAMKNASYHDLKVIFLLADLFSVFTNYPFFDIILCNPPYVSELEWEHISPAIRDYEDKRAIVAGKEGLEIIRNIVQLSRTSLVNGGYLLFEIGENEKNDVLKLLKNAGYTDAQVINDLQTLPRIAVGRWSMI